MLQDILISTHSVLGMLQNILISTLLCSVSGYQKIVNKIQQGVIKFGPISSGWPGLTSSPGWGPSTGTQSPTDKTMETQAAYNNHQKNDDNHICKQICIMLILNLSWSIISGRPCLSRCCEYWEVGGDYTDYRGRGQHGHPGQPLHPAPAAIINNKLVSGADYRGVSSGYWLVGWTDGKIWFIA